MTVTNSATTGYEAELWDTANALRGNMDAAEYKHVVLGLIFLKYVSDAFEETHAQLEAERHEGADPEHPRRIQGPKHPLGAARGPLGTPPVRGSPAHHRADRRRCDGRHRGGEPRARRRAAQELRAYQPWTSNAWAA